MKFGKSVARLRAHIKMSVRKLGWANRRMREQATRKFTRVATGLRHDWLQVRSGIGLLRFGAQDVPARSGLGRVVLRRVLHHLLRAGTSRAPARPLTTCNRAPGEYLAPGLPCSTIRCSLSSIQVEWLQTTQRIEPAGLMPRLRTLLQRGALRRCQTAGRRQSRSLCGTFGAALAQSGGFPQWTSMGAVERRPG